MLRKLNSVGSSIDTETKMIYPNYRDGGIDENNGWHLDECDDYWFGRLSDEDFSTVNVILMDSTNRFTNQE